MQRSNLCLMLVVGLTLLIGCKQGLYEEGKRVYTAYFSNCHMDNGSGLGALIPPLSGSAYLSLQQESLPCIILYGKPASVGKEASVSELSMPGAQLTDVQLLNLINYITSQWGKAPRYTTLEELAVWKSDCSEQ